MLSSLILKLAGFILLSLVQEGTCIYKLSVDVHVDFPFLQTALQLKTDRTFLLQSFRQGRGSL